MVTKHQAMTEQEFHFEAPSLCVQTVGPRGGKKIKTEVWRRNGMCKTWKRSPERFRVPIKHGLYNFSYIDEKNAHMFHAASECIPRVLGMPCELCGEEGTADNPIVESDIKPPVSGNQVSTVFAHRDCAAKAAAAIER